MKIDNNFNDFSKIALGTVDFGTKISKADSFKILDKYFELGGNVIDTSNNYADWYNMGIGESEKCIGDWLRSRKPHKFKISTKAGFRWDLPNKSDLRLNYLQEQFEISLKRLYVDHVDIFWLHRDDRNIPITQIIDTVQILMETGKINKIGCSNWQPDRISMFQEMAHKQNLISFTCIQPLWSLARRNQIDDNLNLVAFDDKQIELCIKNDLSIFPYGSQAAGFFSGNYSKNKVYISSRSSEVESNYYSELNFSRLKRVNSLAFNKCVSTTALSLAYLLNYPLSIFPIIGPRTNHQLAESFQALNISLNHTEINFLLGGHQY